MDLRSLRYFCAAAELGSLTAAAEHCHVAQPSISNAVAQLEFEFTLRRAALLPGSDATTE